MDDWRTQTLYRAVIGLIRPQAVKLMIRKESDLITVKESEVIDANAFRPIQSGPSPPSRFRL
jgi:hypothetical protein